MYKTQFYLTRQPGPENGSLAVIEAMTCKGNSMKKLLKVVAPESFIIQYGTLSDVFNGVAVTIGDQRKYMTAVVDESKCVKWSKTKARVLTEQEQREILARYPRIFETVY